MLSSLFTAALLPLVSALAITPREAAVDYTGYKVFRVAADQDAAAIQEQTSRFHISRLSSANNVDVVVSPDSIASFQALGLNSTTIDEDLGASIASEQTEFSVYAASSDTWFNAYHPFTDHIQFLKDLQTALPSNSEIFNIGTSYQGRVLQGIRIWGSAGKNVQPNIVVHGNVHAREWIASMTVEYLAYQLINGYKTTTAIKTAVDKFQFEILPIVNPDGFAYSQTTDRLWRKNRQPVSGNSCIGRDNNRNWNYQWTVPGGSSTDPCSETYRGLAAADSPETNAMQNHILGLKAAKGVRLYIDTHSYGQYALDAYGYSCTAVATNQATQNSLVSGAAAAIKAVSGTTYTAGPSCKTLYATSGSSTDYVGDVGGAPYAFTFELRDTGSNGFVLPANQIRPTAVETFAGWQYLFARV